jgi:hypothetical protein
MTLLSLALRRRARVPAMPEDGVVGINLLPPELRPVNVTPLGIITALAIGVVAFTLVPLAMHERDVRDRADAAEIRAEFAERDVRGVQFQIAQQRGLQGEIAAARAELDRINTALAALQGGRRPLADDLERLWDRAVLPAGATVTAVEGEDGGLAITGTARDPLDALAYADALSRAGFTAARLTRFAPATTDTGQFTIEVQR